MTNSNPTPITVGVLALQGAFHEHIKLLHTAADLISTPTIQWLSTEVRTPSDLAKCDALIIPGGESTTMSLVAARSGLLEPLRDFVKVHRNPTFGTCAGLILLAESANRTKKGGQDLIGGLDVRVNRNHFGRQTESFETDISLPFLSQTQGSIDGEKDKPFRGIFIRAPVVEKVLPVVEGEQVGEKAREDTVVAPARAVEEGVAGGLVGAEVEVMARLVGRRRGVGGVGEEKEGEGDIIAVRQGNVFGTSFHPELTRDPRIHVWWLGRVAEMVAEKRRKVAAEVDVVIR
ncbi:hypothetical protein MMC30_003334 [Trapelia coarctata]|nr:hypothetical protein [Trapelia coarctata]